MKKIKILSLAIAVLMLVMAFTACNNNNANNTNNNGEKTKVTLTVWGSQEDQAMLKEMCQAFAEANPENEYKFLFGVQGENDAADKVLNDVTSGPDVYSFASDQINKLIAGGALARIGGQNEATVKELNTAGSVDAATITVNGEEVSKNIKIKPKCAGKYTYSIYAKNKKVLQFYNTYDSSM